jgi:osmotically inducible lipoprotein OsmB
MTKTMLLATLALGLAGCGHMTTQERNTAAGAVVGGVAGNAVTHGSTLGTVGGAAVGGAVGHEWDNTKK